MLYQHDLLCTVYLYIESDGTLLNVVGETKGEGRGDEKTKLITTILFFLPIVIPLLFIIIHVGLDAQVCGCTAVHLEREDHPNLGLK